MKLYTLSEIDSDDYTFSTKALLGVFSTEEKVYEMKYYLQHSTDYDTLHVVYGYWGGDLEVEEIEVDKLLDFLV